MLKRQFSLSSQVILLGLLVIGGYIRLIGLNVQSLWFDEVFTQRVAMTVPLYSILTEGVAGDVHPPLYFAFMSIWVQLAGDSMLAIRLPGVLFMLLALPGIYHLARLTAEKSAGVIAVLIYVLSPYYTTYGHEARQYALSALCGVWVMVGLVGITKGKRWGVPVYIVAALAGVYTHYYNGFLIAAVHLWLILSPVGRRTWRVWFASDALIALCFIPQALIAVSQARTVTSAFWIIPPGIAQPMGTITFLIFGSTLSQHSNLYIPALILPFTTLLVMTARVIAKARIMTRTYWFLFGIGLIGVLIPLQIISMIATPLYLDRSFSFLAPMITVMFAIGVIYAYRPSPIPALLGILIVLMLWVSVTNIISPSDPKRPYREVAQLIQTAPDALVVHLTDESYLPLYYYASSAKHRVGELQTRSWLYPRTWELFGVNRLSETRLTQELADYQGTLWLIAPSFIEPPARRLASQINQRACKVEQFDYNMKTAQPLRVYRVTLGAC